MTKLHSEKLLCADSSPYKVNQNIFDSATPGSYSINIDKGVFEVVMCGAGGGGGGSATSHSWLGSNGGSGAAFSGELYFAKSTLTITIGKGGNGGAASGRNASAGTNGTLSSIFIGADNIITANAGNGGFGTGNGAGGNNGAGGTLVVGKAQIVSNTIQSNGVQYSTASPLGNGYGAGGACRASNSGTAGQNGYVRVVYKRRNI